MEDASSNPAIAPCAAPQYILEPEWPHRAVRTTARPQRRDAARNAPRAPQPDPTLPPTPPAAD